MTNFMKRKRSDSRGKPKGGWQILRMVNGRVVRESLQDFDIAARRAARTAKERRRQRIAASHRRRK